MGVLTETEISDLALDRAALNVATNTPITTTLMRRFINDAYADIWEASGGALKMVASGTIWQSANLATGILNTTLITDIKEITRIFASSDANSVGAQSDQELDFVDIGEIHMRRRSGGFGSYASPEICALTRLATTTPSSVNKFRLDYWPGTTGLYFPVHYVPQFTPLDGATITTPDVNDYESRDIALMVAVRLCQLGGRQELVQGILLDISAKTAKTLERKLRALMSGDQDKVAAA